MLDAVTAVDLDFAPVINPGHAEHDGALGLDQAVKQPMLGVLGMLFNVGPEAFHHFGRGLKVFGLTWIDGRNVA